MGLCPIVPTKGQTKKGKPLCLSLLFTCVKLTLFAVTQTTSLPLVAYPLEIQTLPHTLSSRKWAASLSFFKEFATSYSQHIFKQVISCIQFSSFFHMQNGLIRIFLKLFYIIKNKRKLEHFPISHFSGKGRSPSPSALVVSELASFTNKDSNYFENNYAKEQLRHYSQNNKLAR